MPARSSCDCHVVLHTSVCFKHGSRTALAMLARPAPQDSLHNVEASLQHKAAGLGSNIASTAGLLHATLMQQLKPIVLWPVPRWPVYVYFAGAMVCLLTSSVCHLLGCCQKHITEMVWRFDYAGIAVLIVASFVPAMYYAFLCEPWYRNFYLVTTVVMGECVGYAELGEAQQGRCSELYQLQWLSGIVTGPARCLQLAVLCQAPVSVMCSRLDTPNAGRVGDLPLQVIF